MQKKGIILAICSLLGVCGLQAQHYLGVRGGWGGGSCRFTPPRETSIEWGLYSGGISYKFYTATKYVGAIQADLQYMGRGYAFDYVRDGDTSYHRTINSFELPFMWQPHFYVFQRHARVFLNLGVYLDYYMNSKYYVQSKREGIVERGDYPMKLTRDTRWGYGLCGGGGFSVLIRRFEVAVEARYYFGYSDVLRNGTKYKGNPTRSQLDNINVSLAFYYRLGKEDIRSAPSKGTARRMAEAAERRASKLLEKQSKKDGEAVGRPLPEIPADSAVRDLPAFLAPAADSVDRKELQIPEKKSDHEQ